MRVKRFEFDHILITDGPVNVKEISPAIIECDRKSFCTADGKWLVKLKNILSVDDQSFSIKTKDHKVFKFHENRDTADWDGFCSFLKEFLDKHAMKTGEQNERPPERIRTSKFKTPAKRSRLIDRLSKAFPDTNMVATSETEHQDAEEGLTGTIAQDSPEQTLESIHSDSMDFPGSQLKKRKKKNGSGKSRRLRRMSGASIRDTRESDTDEECLMNKPTLTTPATTHLVTPAVEQTWSDSISTESDSHDGAQQSTISSYFMTGSHNVTPRKRDPTPLRRDTNASESWLGKSPSRVSSSRKAQKASLFGTTDDDDDGNNPGSEAEANNAPVRSFSSSSPPANRRVFGSKGRLDFRKQLRQYSRPSQSTQSPPVRRELRSEVPRPSTSESTMMNLRRGLKNLGNTCYLNASIQMFASTDTFSRPLEGGNLCRSVKTVLEDLKAEPQNLSRPVNPGCIKDAIDEKTDKFLGFEQRDAHEFATELIDHMDDEISPSAVGDFNPINSFLLKAKVALTCQHCGYSRSQEETYRHLSIDVISDETGIASIEGGIQSFFAPEVRDLKCEKCDVGTSAKQTTVITQLPKVLLLHLKRFIFQERKVQIEKPTDNTDGEAMFRTEYVFKKDKQRVNLRDKFDFLGDFSAGESPKKYHLKSVVHHIGSRPSSGHYTADTIRKFALEETDESDETEHWVTFDDTSSCVTSLQKVQANINKQRNAYMLLYEMT